MSGEKQNKAKPHYHGHRQRLRERFLAAGGEALPDYELLELLLFGAQPRSDMKPVAKALLDRFGSYARVISATPEELRTVRGVGNAAVVALKAAQASALRLLREHAADGPVISNWQALVEYCRASMGFEKTEQFRLLFLDRKNRIIADEIQQRGTIDHTPVYPREVVKRALDLGAAAIIMVHNHPSQDPSPSSADIEMTREVQEAVAKLGILLHDHIIVGGNRHTSMKELGLI